MILWNYPTECPKCSCKIVRPTWSFLRPTRPGFLAFECADESCQERWEIEALFTARAGLQMPQAFIAHIRLKNVNVECADEKCRSNTNVLIDPFCPKCAKARESVSRKNRCELQLVFARDIPAAARVALMGIDDHTVEQTDVHSIEKLIVDNAERSREHADPDT